MWIGAGQRDPGAGRCRRIASCDAAPDTGRYISGADEFAGHGDGVPRPMTLLRFLHAEALKMKRTIALKMVVLAPAAIVLPILFVTSQAPFSMLNFNGIRNRWTVLALLTLRFWALLMMP